MKAVRQYLGTIWQILQKDLQVEWRGRQGIPVMLVFALMIVFLFNFALQLGTKPAGWAGSRLALGFAGICLHIGVEPQHQPGTRKQCPGWVAAGSCGSVGDLFRQNSGQFLLHHAGWAGLAAGLQLVLPAKYAPLSAGAGDAAGFGGLYQPGYVAVSPQHPGPHPGCILLPVLLYPLALPILIAAVEASRGVLSGQTLGDVSSWLYLLLAGYSCFNAAGLFLFETILEE
jgi:heme exporter protein B